MVRGAWEAERPQGPRAFVAPLNLPLGLREADVVTRTLVFLCVLLSIIQLDSEAQLCPVRAGCRNVFRGPEHLHFSNWNRLGLGWLHVHPTLEAVLEHH